MRRPAGESREVFAAGGAAVADDAVAVARRAKLAEEAAGIEGVVGRGRFVAGAAAAAEVVAAAADAAVSGCCRSPRMRFCTFILKSFVKKYFSFLYSKADFTNRQGESMALGKHKNSLGVDKTHNPL